MVVNGIQKGQRLIAIRRSNSEKYVFYSNTEYIEIDKNIFDCRFEDTKNKRQLKLNI